jgi:hypothetical protein
LTNLLKWILFPGSMVVLRFGGDGGGDSSGQRSIEEETRKAALRARINTLYGVPSSYERQVIDQVPTTVEGEGGPVNTTISVPRTETVQGNSAEVDAAKQAMDEENTKLGDATRGYYADQLGRDYTKAERNTRFKLARQGLMGGSEDVNQQGEVRSDRDLGATRVDDAVRRAVATLTGNREQERLSAVGLVNAGSGDSAVSAAQAGLRNSLANSESAQKVDLFGDLFANSVDAMTGANQTAREAALANRYRNQLSTFFPARSTTSGRVTPSGG